MRLPRVATSMSGVGLGHCAVVCSNPCIRACQCVIGTSNQYCLLSIMARSEVHSSQCTAEVQSTNMLCMCLIHCHCASLLGPPTGWGTTAQANSTCSLAPEGSYSPGGPIASTHVQQCLNGTTNAGTGNTNITSCNACLSGAYGGG
jgi:hypothetical protein